MTIITRGRIARVAPHLRPLNLIRNLWRSRDLLGQFTKRDIEGRYRGSFLGLLWAFVNPLVLLGIYTFIFGVIFNIRWSNSKADSLTDFAQVIFCGITVFTIFSEPVGRAPSLIIGVPNYVKKVVFPLEILPLTTIGTALFHGLISLSILIAWIFITKGYVCWTLPLLPLVVLPLLFLALAVSWFLASLGVFVRDMGYTIVLVLQVLFYMTPIFYSIENVPEPFRTVISYNPLTSIIDNSRRVVLWGIPPDWSSLIVWLLITGCMMLLGYAWFMRTKRAFADVI
jgi:lipopolysaccharide transport system permease protein